MHLFVAIGYLADGSVEINSIHSDEESCMNKYMSFAHNAIITPAWEEPKHTMEQYMDHDYQDNEFIPIDDCLPGMEVYKSADMNNKWRYYNSVVMYKCMPEQANQIIEDNAP